KALPPIPGKVLQATFAPGSEVLLPVFPRLGKPFHSEFAPLLQPLDSLVVFRFYPGTASFGVLLMASHHADSPLIILDPARNPLLCSVRLRLLQFLVSGAGRVHKLILDALEFATVMGLGFLLAEVMETPGRSQCLGNTSCQRPNAPLRNKAKD